MKALMFIQFFVIGLATVFGSCFMMRRVFRWKTKHSLFLSFAAGSCALLTALIAWLSDYKPGALLAVLYAAVFIPAIWLYVTDRSLKSFAVSLSGVVFTVCTGMVLTYPVSLLSVLLQRYGTIPPEPDLTALFGYLCTFGFILLIGRIGKSRITEPMSLWNIVFVALLALFTCELLRGSLPDQSSEWSSRQMLTAAAISLLAVGFILISVLMTVKYTESRYYSTLNSMNESYLNAQKDYYEMKQVSDTEIRRIRHDIKNHLICIRELSAQKRYSELESYLVDLSNAVSDADRLIHTGSGIVDAIVNEKAALARKAHVRFEWEGTISGLHISAVDSCTLVSNLLDNALEACDKVDVDKRYILLSFRRSEHFLLMTCENSAARIVELANGRPLSTKTNKFEHGFGLGNIERVVEKYGGELHLSSNAGEETPVFIAEAVIPLCREEF